MNASTAPAWTITPVDLGSRIAHSHWFFYLEPSSEPLRIVYRAWLLARGGEYVLVDTGPPVDEARRRGIEGMRGIVDGLADLGVDAGAVATVILTHMHWDHAAAADRFPAARILAQRAEIDFFLNGSDGHPAMSRFFSHREMMRGLIAEGRIQALDGDATVHGDLRALRVGGHTPGSQMVAVPTAQGLAVLTGDAIPMNRNFRQAIPNGILVNLPDAVAALRIVRTLDADRIYTGHDPEPFLDVREP